MNFVYLNMLMCVRAMACAIVTTTVTCVSLHFQLDSLYALTTQSEEKEEQKKNKSMNDDESAKHQQQQTHIIIVLTSKHDERIYFCAM